MEYIKLKLEGIIEDIISVDDMDKDEIIQVLNELKDEIEEFLEEPFPSFH